MSKQELVDRAAQEALRLAGPDPASWVRPTPGVDHDVAVVGGGQSGVAIAFALRRAGIPNVTVVDAADDEAAAGVWLSRARMRTLRTPKTRPGPELGIPALSFQAWYEGLHGREAWEAIGRIARTDWHDYLVWFRRQVGVEVRYRTRVIDVRFVEGFADTGVADGHLVLELEVDGVRRTETARKIVWATGVEGSGGPAVPAIFDGLPQRYWAHTGHRYDAESLRGLSVAVLGAGTSALDAAAVALETGAADVHLFSYRPQLVVQPAGGNPQNAGAQDNFHLQPDGVRWRSRVLQARKGSSSPWDSVARLLEHDNVAIHLAAPWSAVREQDGRVFVEAADGSHVFDFVIVGTGYQYDPATRPELAGIADRIALWRDVYEPPADLRHDGLATNPYLGPGYQLTEKVPGAAPWLGDLHLFNAAAAHSFGRPVGDIPSLRTGVPRLVNAIVTDLFFADRRRAQAAAAPAAAPAPAPAPADDRHRLYEHLVWRPAQVEVPAG